MSTLRFNSQIKLLNRFDADKAQIKNEPMLFNCDLHFAYRNGGNITRNFIDALPYDWQGKDVVIDTRCHMLMPGWFPAIPGYHHDDVPRPLDIPAGQHFATAGQPDYENPRYRSEHILALVNAEICPTNFVIGEVEMSKPIAGDIVYRKWHEEITAFIEKGKVEVVKAPDCQLVYFDCDTFHSGTKALSNGWRWFARVSRNTERVNKITNEVRRQVQVYLEYPMQGW